MATGAERTPLSLLALVVVQLGVLAVVLAAVPAPRFDLERHALPKELVLHLTAGTATLLLLAQARRFTLTLADALLAAFLLAGLCSALLAHNPWLAARALAVSLSGAALFWSTRALRHRGWSRALVSAVALAGVLGAAGALGQAWGLFGPALTRALGGLSRPPGGTFGNRNFMAHFTALTLPALALLALAARTRLGALAPLAGAAAMSAALVLSRSRAAWLGAAAAATVFTVELWLLARRSGGRGGRAGRGSGGVSLTRGRALALAGALAAGVLLALAVPNRLAWRSDSPYLESLTGVANYREGSGRGRLIQYRNTLRMAEDAPLLGVGPGNWPVAYPRYTTPRDPAWNGGALMPTNPWPSSDWVALLAERGAAGFVALLLFGGVLLARARRAPSLEGLALTATLVTAVVVGAFDAVLLLPAPALAVFVLAGALAPDGRPIRGGSLPPRRRAWLLAGTALAAALMTGHAALQVAAMRAYTDGKRAEERERAARLDPGSYRIHAMLAADWQRRARCDRARPHAEAARALVPGVPAPRQVLRRCGRRP